MFHRMQWKIEILPRRSGNLRIPSIKVGTVFTPELSLEVSRLSSSLLARQDVFFEIEAQPQNPYVGQSVRLIMRLLHNIPIFDGKILEPEADDIDVYWSGRDSRYLTSRNGKQFNVLERSITLVAQVPGGIRLSPAIYRGRIKRESAPTEVNPEAPSRRIYRDSAALQLQLRNPPVAFSGTIWLPARQLKISRRWEAISDDLKVGDSLGFSMAIEARGLPAEALPSDLVTGYSDKFTIYADPAVRSNHYQDNEVVGKLEQRFVVVVSQPGEIMLPATTLKWWDVSEDVERVAQLEPRTLSVATRPEIQFGNVDSSRTGSDFSLLTGPDKPSIRANWLWVVLFSAGLMVSISLILFTRMRRQISRKIKSGLAARRNLRALKKACLANDPRNARRELLKWGRRRWPADNINSLSQIDARTEAPELGVELAGLDRALYAKQGSGWQGRRLWQLLVAASSGQPARPDREENSLPKLYPRQNLSTH